MANPYGGSEHTPFYDGSDGEDIGGGTPPDLSSYAKKSEVKDYDEVGAKNGIPTSSDFTAPISVIRDKQTGKLYTQDSTGDVVEIGGGFKLDVKLTPTSGSTLSGNTCYFIKTTSGNKNYNLPTANSDNKGQIICITKATDDKNIIAIAGKEVIRANESIRFTSSGTEWKIMDKEDSYKQKLITSDYTQIDETVFYIDASANPVTLTLNKNFNRHPTIIKVINIDNSIQVQGDIEGNSTFSFSRVNESIIVDMYEENNYAIVGYYKGETNISDELGDIYSIVGEFVYKFQGSKSDTEMEESGYFPLKQGTYTNYVQKYPIASERIPDSWKNGNDWVIPADIGGTFIRNTGGNASTEGTFQGDSLKPHNHTLHYFADGSKRFANGNTYGDYLVRRDSDRTTSTTGDTETRPKNIALQLCLIVDSIGKALVLPDTVDVAHEVTVKINGGATKVNNKTSETIYAGVGAYRLIVEVEQGKMIDPLSATNWTLIDAHKGIIEYQVDRSDTDDTKDLTVDFLDLSQEGLLSTVFLYTSERAFSGSSETVLFTTPNYTKLNGTKIEIDVRLPYRSNESAWGGAYTNIYYSLDDGSTWKKFINSGYDAVMYDSSRAIESWNFSGILDILEVKASEQIKFRVTATTYNNKTVYLNKYHDIKNVDTDKNLGYANMSIKEIGTLYGVNPNYNNAPLSKLTFQGLTVENGKTELILLEGNIYHVKVDITPDKRIKSVTSSNSNVKSSIVDSENGFISVDMPIGGGDSTITLQDENKPARTTDYCIEPNPEGITDFEFCVLYSPLVGDCPRVVTNPDNFFINDGQYIRVQGVGTPHFQAIGDGIGGASFDFPKIKTYTNYKWNMNKRSFVFSFWVKAYEGVNNMYSLGNDISGTNRKSLHVGWRDGDTFTLAFYASDVNWDSPNGINRGDTIDKWFHYVVAHNTTTKKSKLFINGQFVSEKTHSGQYESYFNMINGTQNTERTKSKISNIRLFTKKYNVAGYVLTDAQIQNIYTQEKKVLEEM